MRRFPLTTRGRAMTLCAAFLALTPGLSFAQRVSEPTATAEPGTIEHNGTSYEVEYGTFHVPMNRRDAASGTIALRYVRYKSAAAKPGAPVVFLAGGPGGSGIATMEQGRAGAFLALLDEREFIAFDQRGTGVSEPSGLRFNPGVNLPPDRPGDPQMYAEIYRESLRVMLATMRERGIDVRGLTTEESADDIAALCDALGVKKIALWGSSYGTHLALATARRHPDRVEALVLAGTEGPDHTFKLPANIQINLERLAELVDRDPVYGVKLPDFLGTVERLLDDLEKNPRRVTLAPGFDVVVGKWDLQKALSGPMGSRGGMQQIPARIYSFKHDNFFDLAKWAVGFRSDDNASAMGIVMDCASWGSTARIAEIERQAERTLAGAAIDFPMPCLCEVDGMPRLGDDFRAPLVTDVPALFISGTLDGRTPVSNAEEVARTFRNARHLIIRNASHGGDLFASSPLIVPTVQTFLRGESLPPVQTVDGPTWVFEPPFSKSLAHDMLRLLSTDGLDAAVARYEVILAEHAGGDVYDFREPVLNELGYGVMRSGMTDLAIEIFRLNTIAFPDGFNAWDSLAEAYMEQGDLGRAEVNYRKSLELNPENANARQMLAHLQEMGG